MGKGKKEQPNNLAAKLLEIRKFLNLTQEEMVRLVIPKVESTSRKRSSISEFEKGYRAPSLLEVFHYAEAVRKLTKHKKLTTDDLLDDRRELPWLAKKKTATD